MFAPLAHLLRPHPAAREADLAVASVCGRVTEKAMENLNFLVT